MQHNNIFEKLVAEAVRRYKFEKYRYFVPIRKTEIFINRLFSGKYFIGLLSAANGIGKTTAAVNILAHLFWPVGNKFFQAPLFKNWPFLKKGRIVSDPTTVQETIIPALEEWFPAGRYSFEKKGKNYEYSWKTDTGWEFTIMTYEQDVKEFESATLGWAWFDEPPPKAIFDATVARMRRGGLIWITATPLSGSAWMFDEIVANQDAEGKWRFFVEAELEDACEEHGERGFLKHEDILKMISQYDQDELAPRVFGKFKHLSGLVFKKFNPNVHVIKPFQINSSDFAVFEALDPHPRNPDAVMWVAVDRQGRKFVVDELYENLTIEELAEKIKRKASNFRVVKRIADPAAFVKDQHSGYSLADKLAEFGLYYEPGSKERTQAIQLIKNDLDYAFAAGEFIKQPMLFVFETCKRTIWEFQHWQWEEWRGKAAERKNPREKPQDKDDHMMENLGRILLANPKFIEGTAAEFALQQQIQSPFYERVKEEQNIELDPYE